MSQPIVLPNGIQSAGLRAGARLLVSYVGDEYWHDRLLLAHVHGTIWVVATPHFDVYVEDLADYADMHPQGPRGGIPQKLLGDQRVPFKEKELRAEFAQLMADGQAEATELRKTYAADGGGDGGQDLPAEKTISDHSWIFMESRGVHKQGDIVPI